MYQKIILATACVAALSLAGCGKKESGGAADQANQPVNTAQDLAAATTGVGTAAVGAISTDAFLTDAAISDMYEIEAAKMAMARSRNPEIKKLAQMITADHTASTEKLKMLVSSGQAAGTLPTAMDERRKGMLDNLRGASDQDFDDRYLDQQTMAHHEGLLLMNGYKSAGTVEPLKAFAAEMIPKMQMHLDMVTNLDRHTKADDPAGATAPRP